MLSLWEFALGFAGTGGGGGEVWGCLITIVVGGDVDTVVFVDPEVDSLATYLMQWLLPLWLLLMLKLLLRLILSLGLMSIIWPSEKVRVWLEDGEVNFSGFGGLSGFSVPIKNFYIWVSYQLYIWIFYQLIWKTTNTLSPKKKFENCWIVAGIQGNAYIGKGELKY